MCGIAACAGVDNTLPFLSDALKRLEYRGYDSWGLVLQDGKGAVRGHWEMGPPSLNPSPLHPKDERVGLAHTRWATHGKPSFANAHPIRGGAAWVVHNGVVDNYEALKCELRLRGCDDFVTDTDTEAIAHLIDVEAPEAETLAHLIVNVGLQLRGNLAFAFIHENWPGLVGLYSNGAPLLVSANGYAGSDIYVFSGYAESAYRLEKGMGAVIGDDGLRSVITSVFKPDWFGNPDEYLRSVAVPELPESERGSGHAMLAEIRQQPLTLSSPAHFPKELPYGDRVVLFGCGSSYNAALLGRHFLEQAGAPTQVEYASEIHGRLFESPERTLFVALTQSGETKDTLDALEHVIQRYGKHRAILITNEEHSQAASMVWTKILTGVGPERGVAATKTFTAQVAAIAELAYRGPFAPSTRVDYEEVGSAVGALLADQQLDHQIRSLSSSIPSYDRILYLGRGINHAVALEGALKMKEVAQVQADALHAGEMKHGPIALVDEHTLAVFIVDEESGRVRLNMREMRARGGRVVVVGPSNFECDPHDQRLQYTSAPPLTHPFLSTIILHLLAYWAAVAKDLNPDFPANLAKCVTVE